LARILILSFSPVESDTRVRRQCAAYLAAGHAVTTDGHDGPSTEAWPGGALIRVAAPRPGWANRLLMVLRSLPARLGLRPAIAGHFLYPAFRRIHAASRDIPVDLIHANDWPMLPVALAASRARPATRLLYDSHEYAQGERESSALWRAVMKPAVLRIEGGLIRQADAVVTVSEGIAELLEERYRLATRPTVVRNAYDGPAMPFRATGSPIRLLFHGLLCPDRGLESLIEALALLPEDRCLILRGGGDPRYVAGLRALAERSGVSGRVAFAPPVTPAQVVPMANAADVGVFAPPLDMAQTRHALPNKLFEYVAAGLALCVTEAPEMAALVDRYRLGVVSQGSDAAAIAAALGRLDAAAIDAAKRRAVAVAADFSWQIERARLLSLVEALLAQPR
jgi:glycosyltransferase involved in cell wall biosynthesis